MRSPANLNSRGTRRLAGPLAIVACALGCQAGAPARPLPSPVAPVTLPRVEVDRDPLGALPEALYGAQLPERISDSTFWRMVLDLSEAGGYFQSENFVSNEMGLQHVIGHLETLTPPGGTYVGVGPEQNFTYIGALRPRIAFVVDIRRQNLLQHLWYKAIFEMSTTRAEFLARLFSRPAVATTNGALSADSLITLLDQAPPDLAMFNRTFDAARARLITQHGFTLDSSDLATLRYVDSIFVASGPMLNYSSGSGGRGRGGFNRMPTFAQIAIATNERGINRGFLGSEASYRVVRDMQRRNLIVPVVGDFGGPKALRAVGSWLRARNARVNVFYTSNVEQYLFQYGSWPTFYANVGTMPLDSTSRFIRSVTSRGFGGGFGGGNGTGFLMQQLTSSIFEIVRGAESGAVRSYYDVQNLSRPQ
jgi:hypothetical protein